MSIRDRIPLAVTHGVRQMVAHQFGGFAKFVRDNHLHDVEVFSEPDQHAAFVRRIAIFEQALSKSTSTLSEDGFKDGMRAATSVMKAFRQIFGDRRARPALTGSSPCCALVGEERQQFGHHRRCEQGRYLARPVVERVGLDHVAAHQIEPVELAQHGERLMRREAARLRRLDAGRRRGIDEIHVKGQENGPAIRPLANSHREPVGAQREHVVGRQDRIAEIHGLANVSRSK
jgi:hypothetical protein